VVETEDPEDSLDRRPSAKHVEPVRVVIKSRSRRDQDPDAGGVDEVKATEVQKNLLGVARLEPFELRIETACRRQVQFSENLDQVCRPLTFAADREQSFLKQAAFGARGRVRLGGVVVQAVAIQRRAAIASCYQLPVTTRLHEPDAQEARIAGPLRVCDQEELDDDLCANEDLAVIVQNLEASDPLDLLDDLVVELFLPGKP
jgi:hypothetical protein